MINTQAPLVLTTSKWIWPPFMTYGKLIESYTTDERQLVMDLLSVHLIRKQRGSVIISYHPTKDIPITTARYLHERIRFAGKHLTALVSDIISKKTFLSGQSVYWQSIFQKSPDPTFVLLTFIWHAIYAWDEAFEALYTHICKLVSHAIQHSDVYLQHSCWHLGRSNRRNNRLWPDAGASHHSCPSFALHLFTRRLAQVCDLYTRNQKSGFGFPRSWRASSNPCTAGTRVWQPFGWG